MTAEQYQKLEEAEFTWGELSRCEIRSETLLQRRCLMSCYCLVDSTRLDSYVVIVPENLSRSWYARLEDLKKFHNEHGHSRVPKEYPANPQLVAWCQNQRAHYRAYMLGKKSCMTAERVKLLEDAGFLFEVNGSERSRGRSSQSRRAALEEDKSEASEESEDEEDDPEVPMVAAARQGFSVTGHQNNGYNPYRDQGYHATHAYHHHQQPHYPPPF
jgi:Helicase associated domain